MSLSGISEAQKQFYTLFGVPPVAYPVIDAIVTPTEQAAVLALGANTFSASEAAAALKDAVKTLPVPAGPYANDFAGQAYRRGVFSRVDDDADGGEKALYRIADFYLRLDLFVRAELESYRSFDVDTRRALDGWFFDAYYTRLNISRNKGPSEDAMLTLGETISFIDKQNRQVYLTNCDCRSLAQGLYGSEPCAKPLLTCLSYHAGVNTTAHRGISKPISKEQAKQVVLMADKAGLTHTVGAYGICNCCGDCCYVTRARARRNAEIGLYENPAGAVTWPLQTKTVKITHSLCTGCGLCTKRCPFALFTLNNTHTHVDTSRCIGCGLCVNTCPAGALSLILNPL
jgi:Pyruvate/2-oxoacid:ferredoxin oxidoreductase delta subunit